MSILTIDSINVRKDEAGLFSVFDAIQFIAQKANQRKVWEQLRERHPDIVKKITMSKPIGIRQKPTPMADKATIIEIISLLPGKVGGETRRAAIELLLKYFEAPDELAKAAIARITDQDKLGSVYAEVKSKYLQEYNPLMGEIKKREGLTPTTYQHANIVNTKTCMGAEPSVIKAQRGGKTARVHATETELVHLATLQNIQCAGLKKADARGHAEIAEVITLAANDFQAMLEKYGVI